jgi:hypothetical protein
MVAAATALLSFSCVACGSCIGRQEPTSEPTGEPTTGEPTGETAQSILKVFCTEAEHGAPCSARCMAAGIGCVYAAVHPRKAAGGIGKLYACNSLTPGFMCSYTYPNGDTCHFPFGRPGFAWCVYTAPTTDVGSDTIGGSDTGREYD